MTDKIIEELTEENMSDPNWSNQKSNEKQAESPPHIEEERILSLTVDIPQGTQEVLEIRASDDIEGITERFCQKHDLDAECKQMLLDNIRAHLFGNGTTDQQIQEEQNEEDRNDTEVRPENSNNIGSAELEPHQIGELAEELETWKKEAEEKIRSRIASSNKPVINENSRKIVEKQGLSKIPVYERLHKRALVKQRGVKKAIPEKVLNVKDELSNEKSNKKPQKANSETGNKKSKDNNVFHHLLLYQKGVKQMYEREKITEQAMQKKTEKDLKEAPFKPKINSNSRMMVSRETEKHEDYLLSYGKLVQEKLMSKKFELEEQELKGNFRPSISIASKKLNAQKSVNQRPSSAYDLLYEDAKHRIEKAKEPIPTQFSFIPSTIELNPNLFKGVDKKPSKNPIQYFFFA